MAQEHQTNHQPTNSRMIHTTNMNASHNHNHMTIIIKMPPRIWICLLLFFVDAAAAGKVRGSRNKGSIGSSLRCIRFFECSSGCPTSDAAGNEYLYPTAEQIDTGRYTVLTPLYSHKATTGPPVGRLRAAITLFGDAENSGTVTGALELYRGDKIGITATFFDDETQNYGSSLYAVGSHADSNNKPYTVHTTRIDHDDPNVFVVEYKLCREQRPTYWS